MNNEISTRPSDHVERVASEIINCEGIFSRQKSVCSLVSEKESGAEFHEYFSFHGDEEAEKFFNTVINMVELRTGHVDVVCNTVSH